MRRQNCCRYDQRQNARRYPKNVQHQKRLYAGRRGTSAQGERVVRRTLIKKQSGNFLHWHSTTTTTTIIIIMLLIISPIWDWNPVATTLTHSNNRKQKKQHRKKKEKNQKKKLQNHLWKIKVTRFFLLKTMKNWLSHVYSWIASL